MMFLLILGFVLMLEGKDLNRLLVEVPVSDSNDAGDCKILEASTWGEKIQATYTDCTKYDIPAAITFIVKVPEITNTEHCPLIKDWVISAGCPDGLFGVCTIKESFEISTDVCDMILALSTGAAAMAANAASNALLNKLGSGISWQKDMASKLVENFGKGVEIGVSQSNGQGLCANSKPGIKDLLKCLFVNSNINVPGLEAFLEIVSQSITSTVNAGMDFNILKLQIENVGISIDLSANLDGLDSGAVTLLAKTEAFRSLSTNCDKLFHMAKKMTASIKLTPEGFSGTFEITCEKVFLLPQKIGEMIKGGAQAIQNSIANARENIKDTLLKAKDKLSKVCETIKKPTRVCENVTKTKCRRKRRGRRECNDVVEEKCRSKMVPMC